MKTSTLLITVLGAAAAGVVVGLLIAPDKGSETRKKVSSKAQDLANQFKGMKDSVVDKYKVARDGRHHVESEMTEGRV